MDRNDKKTTFIILCVCIIVIGAIIYYLCTKDEASGIEFLEEEENVTQENVLIEEETNSVSENNDEVTVYITGAVNSPGVYTLPQGSRIADAVAQAQGLRDDADAEEINLAYVMEDGMHIKFPTKEEKQNNDANQQSYISSKSVVSESSSEKNTIEKININSATKEQLETLSGIGASTAEKIIQYRKENGNFKNVEDIKNVSGIGENKYNKIKDKICVK